nr:RNA-directed DNA polymerase, eukaryota, reverse transcriptase zinc-binding domain protein [Tanacetum cinerariifolium]
MWIVVYAPQDLANSLLNDVPLGGYHFTWSNKKGTKMRKLDRFFVSDNFFDAFPNITGVVLEKGIPDHRPILLKVSENIDVASSFTPEFPPGFTPTMEGSSSKCNPHQGQVSSHCAHSDFSLIERLWETIKVGTALGLNMEGCENTLTEMIAGNGDLKVDLWKIHQAWGNSHFDFAASLSRGLSGGILCVWNNLLFLKSKISSHDNFVVVEGLWTPTDARIMWIVVVFNTRRQQVEGTYHVTFDESMEAIRFTKTLEDESGIDDSSGYPLDEFLNEDDPSRHCQADVDISYHILPHIR